MAENKTTWELDLDVVDASEAMEHFKGKLGEVGEAGEQSLTKLVSVLGEVGVAAGVLGVAFLALKGTLDLVFEAEEIAAVNQQFEALTKNAGLSGEALKEGLLEATGGLVSEVDLLKAANKALVSFNGTSEQMIGLMTLARQATAVMGGDLMTNFNGIVKSVESGNSRMLKHLGIVIDQKKAYKDYAESIGIAVSEMGAAEKSQALMNAALEFSNSNYKGVNLNIKEGTNLWQETKVVFSEMGEAFTVFFGSVFGPTVIQGIKVLKSFATDVKGLALAAFGDESQKAASKIKGLNAEIAGATKQVEFYQQALAHPTKFQSVESLTKSLDYQKARIEKAQVELEKYEGKKGELAQRGLAAEEAGNTRSGKLSAEALELRLKNTQKYQSEIDKLKEAALQEDLKNTQSSERLEEIRQQTIVAIQVKARNDIAKMRTEMVGHGKQADEMQIELERKAASEIGKIDQEIFKKKEALLKTEMAQARSKQQVDAVNRKMEANLNAQKDMDLARADALYAKDAARLAAERLAIERKTTTAIKALEDNLDKERMAADKKYVQDANSSAVEIGHAFTDSMEQARKSATDMRDIGSGAFNALQGSATAAFMAIGNGSQSAGTAMKNAMLQALGQMAISKGSFYIGTGIADLASLNPIGAAEIAAGGSLVALGSWMQSQGGGGGASAPPTGGGGGGGAAPAAPTGPNTSGAADAGPSVAAASGPQKNVSLIVQGNMYSGNEAKTEMIDLMRKGTDATGFRYQQVGTTA